MKMMIASVTLALGVGLGVVALAQNPPAGPVPGYFGIAPGHDFPASEATLEGYRASGDAHNQRLHVWNVFAGITDKTPDGKYARWETWYSEDETFQSGATPQGLGPHRVQRRFRLPRQFEALPGAAVPQAAGTGLLSFVLFDWETYNHIRSLGLYKRAVLDGYATTGAPDRNFPDNKTIPEFPREAMSLKVVWWPVAGNKTTAMPVWDGDFAPSSTAPKPPSTWKRVVAITPTGNPAPNATANVVFGGKSWPSSHLVGLSAFHAVRLDAALAAQINSDPNLSAMGQSILGRAFRAGDYVVLAGMHMTTKEIKDWVWATFWWHDKPKDGPFAADRPASLGAPWNHYLMSASYDVNTPKEADGSPHIAFNPWLEARFPNGGTTTNCMTCHNRSNNNGTPFMPPLTRGNPTPTDPAFAKNTVRPDFLWSIPFNAQ